MVGAVARAPLDGRLASDLDCLEVSSRYSVVRRVSYPIDPMRRFHADSPRPLAPATDSPLGRVAALLEWAYGYRCSQRPGRPHTRRSPSAGALYPTECFVLSRAEGAWAIYYYDYRTHGYYRLRRPQPESLARWLGVGEDASVVILSSVLWRSAQRYGARCYLYCLLDAGNVASNLASAALHHGVEIAPTRRSLMTEHERQVGMRVGEGVMFSLPLYDDGSRPVAMPSAPAVLPRADPRCLQPPTLSPVLTRIGRLHSRTLLSDHVTPVAALGMNRQAEYPTVAERRHSASAFAFRPLSGDGAEAMAACCSTSLRALHEEGMPQIDSWLVSIRPADGGTPCTQVIERDGALGDRARDFAGTEDAAAMLAEACQNQAIVRGSAFAIVLGLDLEELAVYGYGGLRTAALGAGAVSADLYREAACRSIGTTLVGGFSPRLLSEVVATTTSWPMAVQLFGVEGEGASKVDAARVISSAEENGNE